ncbi:MAG: hypothetical protein Q8O99_03435 [bacterium]|nr:hypothetical protein [bacterium]
MGLSRDVLPESDSSQETQQYGSNVLRGTDTDAKESNQHTTDLNIQQIAQDQSFTGGGSSISAYDDSKGTTPIIDRNPGTKVEKIDIPVLPNF